MGFSVHVVLSWRGANFLPEGSFLSFVCFFLSHEIQSGFRLPVQLRKTLDIKKSFIFYFVSIYISYKGLNDLKCLR